MNHRKGEREKKRWRECKKEIVKKEKEEWEIDKDRNKYGKGPIDIRNFPGTFPLYD